VLQERRRQLYGWGERAASSLFFCVCCCLCCRCWRWCRSSSSGSSSSWPSHWLPPPVRCGHGGGAGVPGCCGSAAGQWGRWRGGGPPSGGSVLLCSNSSLLCVVLAEKPTKRCWWPLLCVYVCGWGGGGGEGWAVSCGVWVGGWRGGVGCVVFGGRCTFCVCAVVH
jgi:hypothetical protein